MQKPLYFVHTVITRHLVNTVSHKRGKDAKADSESRAGDWIIERQEGPTEKFGMMGVSKIINSSSKEAKDYGQYCINARKCNHEPAE
jgi:hypothetical protein